MSTTQARTRATAAWRARNGLKLVQAYLHTDTLAKLDAMVEARGASGRGAVLAGLIEGAHEALDRPTRPLPEVPAVSTPRQHGGWPEARRPAGSGTLRWPARWSGA